jgi:hypothetical protein
VDTILIAKSHKISVSSEHSRSKTASFSQSLETDRQLTGPLNCSEMTVSGCYMLTFRNITAVSESCDWLNTQSACSRTQQALHCNSPVPNCDYFRLQHVANVSCSTIPVAPHCHFLTESVAFATPCICSFPCNEKRLSQTITLSYSSAVTYQCCHLYR